MGPSVSGEIGASDVRVRGVVQGVGFRPFVWRLARAHDLAGWVLNDGDGVAIHVEGAAGDIDAFVAALENEPPPAALLASVDVAPADVEGLAAFVIRASADGDHPTARISPDLAVCDACVRELFDPADPRHGYPYINCTDCGPRYSILLGLPYDRAHTTMRAWPLVGLCAREYEDPRSRRFHAQPVACPSCGPQYTLRHANGAEVEGDPIEAAAALLRAGRILALKGLGGYHLACDARNATAVRALRERKFRKEKPFALMAKTIDGALAVARLADSAVTLLRSPARPIVIAPAVAEIPGVAPENIDLGVMLPYTPVHHLLCAAGAPELLVMTSANRSSEPIAIDDADALDRLGGIADAFLIGERPIARRVEDSVVTWDRRGVTFLRRSRGYSPGVVATLPADRPLLALGADLKNAITLVVDGQAFVSPFIGDLEDFKVLSSFRETVRDLVSMYGLRIGDIAVAHDAHPAYASVRFARSLRAHAHFPVQHHRAHVASVLAEIGELERPVLGVSMDGTGWGDDGTIWGCELFAGSVREGFQRVAHLRTAALIGGDAAATAPVQAAAGFLAQLDDLPDVRVAPFSFPPRYDTALGMLQRDVRVFRTSSAGRLFDTVAALLGFTRTQTFEGQAAIRLEHVARDASNGDAYPFPLEGEELDFRPLLQAVVRDRARGRDAEEIARAFHAGLARGLADACRSLCRAHALDTVAGSGGVFQNRLLVDLLTAELEARGLSLVVNHLVPPNDGGVSLGQAALATFQV